MKASQVMIDMVLGLFFLFAFLLVHLPLGGMQPLINGRHSLGRYGHRMAAVDVERAIHVLVDWTRRPSMAAQELATKIDHVPVVRHCGQEFRDLRGKIVAQNRIIFKNQYRLNTFVQTLLNDSRMAAVNTPGAFASFPLRRR